jgi:hypothetical protein
MTNSLFTLQSTPPPQGQTPRSGLASSSPNVAYHRRITPVALGLALLGLSPGRSCAATVVEVPIGGGERDRTDDLLLAKQALSQLSYTPFSGARGQASGTRNILTPGASCLIPELVGQGGFEPPTSRLSSARSNQLSY